MAKRKTNSEPTDDLLSHKPADPKPIAKSQEPIAKDPPKVLEYTPLGSTDKWRVERFAELEAEMGILRGNGGMMEFHELGLRHPRPWLICQKLFGIFPMMLPTNSDPAEFEVQTRAEVCATMGIEPKQLQAELDSLRAVWTKTEVQSPESKVQSQTPGAQAAKGELPFGDDVLAEFGFDEGMFEVKSYEGGGREPTLRPDKLNRLERNWFCKRVSEWRRMLGDIHAGGLARSCLMNELYLKRFEQEMAVLGPSSKKWQDLHEMRQELEETYQKQLTELQAMFPETATAAKESYRRTISELIKADQEYYANGSHALIDGMMTADEIEVGMRMSVQRPEPQYRFGLNMAIALAKEGINNPNWKPYIKHSVYKKMDAMAKAAVVGMREAMAEPLVDLEKGVLPGEGDDFEDLQKLPES